MKTLASTSPETALTPKPDAPPAVKQKAKRAPKAAVCKETVARMKLKLRERLMLNEPESEFERVWRRLKNLCEHPNPNVCLKALTLYCSYVLGAPSQEIEASVTTDISPAEKAELIKVTIENRLGIVNAIASEK